MIPITFLVQIMLIFTSSYLFFTSIISISIIIMKLVMIEVNGDDTLGFTLFCHQCNTKEKICQPMVDIILDIKYMSKKNNLYHQLVRQ